MRPVAVVFTLALIASPALSLAQTGSAQEAAAAVAQEATEPEGEASTAAQEPAAAISAPVDEAEAQAAIAVEAAAQEMARAQAAMTTPETTQAQPDAAAAEPAPEASGEIDWGQTVANYVVGFLVLFGIWMGCARVVRAFRHIGLLPQEVAARLAYGGGSRAGEGRLTHIIAIKEVRDAWDYYRGRTGRRATVGAFVAFAQSQYGKSLAAGGDQNANIPPEKMAQLLSALAASLMEEGIMEVTLAPPGFGGSDNRGSGQESQLVAMMEKAEATRANEARQRQRDLSRLQGDANHAVRMLEIARGRGDRNRIIHAEASLQIAQNKLRGAGA